MEPPRDATVFMHDPAQAGFDGRGVVVEIVPVEAHPRFQAETVSCSQASEPDPVRASDAEQVLGEGECERGGNGDLEAVFACVAAAGDQDLCLGGIQVGEVGGGEGGGETLTEIEGFDIQILHTREREDALEDLCTERALQGDQALGVTDFPCYVTQSLLLECFDLGGQVCEVFLFTGRIGDDVEELGSEAVYDGVVNDASGEWMEEAGESRLVLRESCGGGGGYGLEERSSARAGEMMLDPVVSPRLACSSLTAMSNGSKRTCAQHRTSCTSRGSIYGSPLH